MHQLQSQPPRQTLGFTAGTLILLWLPQCTACPLLALPALLK